MDYLIISILIVLGNLLSDVVLVVVINPRRASHRIKSEILHDRSFQIDLMTSLTSPEILPIYDPLLEKLRQKLQGSAIQQMGQVALGEKEIGKALLADVKESSLEGDLLLEGLKISSPNLYKLAQRRPELIPKILERARSMGLMGQSLSDSSGFDPYH